MFFSRNQFYSNQWCRK